MSSETPDSSALVQFLCVLQHTCHCKGGKSFNSGHLPGRTVFLTSNSQPLLRNLIAFDCYRGSEWEPHSQSTGLRVWSLWEERSLDSGCSRQRATWKRGDRQRLAVGSGP